MGCYLGIEKINRWADTKPPLISFVLIRTIYRRQSVAKQIALSRPEPRPRWEGKGYHIGEKEDVMREVLFSIEM
jgi:hypothetical protein